jgi:hypothetical protein
MSQISTQVEVELLQTPRRGSTVVEETVLEPQSSTLSKTQSSGIIITVACVSFLNTLGSGLLTVALPRIAKDLELPKELLLWSVSSNASHLLSHEYSSVDLVVGQLPSLGMRIP